MSLYLREDVAAIPLIDGWYAWSQLVEPVSYALNITHRYIPLLESFVEAPDVHAEALENEALLGGPFVGLPATAVDRAAALLADLREKACVRTLSDAIRALYRELEERREVGAVADIAVPDALRGLAEVSLDVLGRPHVRFRSFLIEDAGLAAEARPSLYLCRLDPDHRPFVFSTPFVDLAAGVDIAMSFTDRRIDNLFRAFDLPAEPVSLGADLGLAGDANKRFSTLFSESPPRRRHRAPAREALHWRHFGHGCVLVEAEGRSVLIDPLIAHASPEHGPDRPTYGDLPPLIDAVLLTHNHQDHVTLETLLRIRHRVGAVIVPNALDTLEDPSVAGLLGRLGYETVHILEEFGRVRIGEIQIDGFPFSGEHGDLNIRSRLNYKVSCGSRALFFAADSDVSDIRIYERCKERIGRLDVLFLGMECEGAPASWVYGPLFPKPLPWREDQARRLSGADFEAAKALVDTLGPEAVYIYAMGEEPWVTHISSKAYTPHSLPLKQAAELVQYCQSRGLPSARLVGCPSGKLSL